MKKKTRQEALAVANGMYAMNAPYAIAYAFTESEERGGGVNLGEFIADVTELTFDRFDGFIERNRGNELEYAVVQTLKEGRTYHFDDRGNIRMKQKGKT